MSADLFMVMFTILGMVGCIGLFIQMMHDNQTQSSPTERFQLQMDLIWQHAHDNLNYKWKSDEMKRDRAVERYIWNYRGYPDALDVHDKRAESEANG